VDGYSTTFEEIDSQLTELTGGKQADIVIVPVGVGSLAQAAVMHYKQPERSGKTKIVTVEPDTAACLKKALLHSSDSSPAPSGILTSSTIMTGLNCPTVSPMAWPYLHAGVDVATSVADVQVHKSVTDLRSMGVDVGPCGAAPLTALRQIAAQPDQTILEPDSIVVLLATEGPRDYPEPLDATSTDPIALTQILTRIDSSNPDLSSEAGGGESKIAEYLFAWLMHHDFEVHRLETHAGRPSVVGVAKGSGGGKTLMFNGHIDTVVHGRGSFDMKAGIAASLVAVYRANCTGNLRGDIILALVADEENLSIGTQELLAAGWHADAAVISEPTGHEMLLSHKGFIWAEVDIIGKAGHGSRPDLCVDAITKAGHFLVALEKFGEALMNGQVEEAVRHPKLGTGTIHASLITGGEELSSYPALCTISIERRTVPGETTRLVENQLNSILNELSKNVPGFKSTLRMGESRAPYDIDENHAFVEMFAEHARVVLGTEVAMAGGSYWADSALLAEKGIPAVLFGVQGGGAHASKEWADTDSIAKVAETLKRVALDFCC